MHSWPCTATLTFSSKRVDLIVWPETAVPVLKENAEGFEHDGALCRRPNSALITGVPIRQEVRHEPRYFNGITAVGRGDGVYLKQSWCRLANTCRCRMYCAA